MKKILITALITFLVTAVGSYFHLRGEDYRLYKEAKELESQGDISGAHNKIYDALKINPKNRKVLAYKAELYFLVQNDAFMKKAIKNRDDAIRAMERGDYITAADKLDEALLNAGSVSSGSSQYPLASELQEQLIKDVDRLLKEAPRQYYNKAMEFYQNGEYERAYGVLDYILKPDSKIVKLKDELAYLIGSGKFDEVMETPDPTKFLIRDSISWLKKVSENSPDNIDAKAKISKLNEVLKTMEEK